MILSAFPDLQWLKQKIEQRFRQPAGADHLPGAGEGFPNVIIHTTAKETYRPDIVGPVSLFLNLSGRSRCAVEGRQVEIGEDTFFISNRFQAYTLEIESSQPVETFNIHIGETFSEGVFSALLTPTDTILNNGLQQKAVTVAFHNQLYRRDAAFNQLVQGLKETKENERFDKIAYEEGMTGLLVYLLLLLHRSLLQQIAKLPALKQSTRLEVYRRLAFAVDFLHSHPTEAIDLNALAATACLSKFHFLRLFKQAYGVSPYQYWQNIRLEKAQHLLKRTAMPVHEIADMLGFENSNSFSRLFRQRQGQYPSQYRLAVN